jgi:phage gpG-like protein
MTTITVKNAAVVRAMIEKYGVELEDRVGEIVQGIAENAMSDAKKAVERGTRTGRIYNRNGKKHQASAPLESPKNDTGKLASSFYYKQNNKMSATIGSNLDYAYYLEYGTMNIKPRPTWVLVTFAAKIMLNKKIDELLKRLKP